MLCKGRGPLGELLFSESTVSGRKNIKQTTNPLAKNSISHGAFVSIQAAAKPAQMKRQALALVQKNHSRRKAHTCPWGKSSLLWNQSSGLQEKCLVDLARLLHPSNDGAKRRCSPTQLTDTRTPRQHQHRGADSINTPEYPANPALRFPNSTAEMSVWRRSQK